MLTNKTTNIIFSGLGGQGIVLASRIAAEVFLLTGHDVKFSMIQGMAQRSSPVISHLRVGKKILSPLISNGEADMLISLDLIETIRTIGLLKNNGLVITVDKAITPYPNGSLLKKHFRFIINKSKKNNLNIKTISLDYLINSLPSNRTMNIFMLGVLSNNFSIVPELWLKVIKKNIPRKTFLSNTQAFSLGRGYPLKLDNR